MKRDCYFYDDYYHQGKIIPVCRLTTEVGKTINKDTCDKCSYCISVQQVRCLAKKYVKWTDNKEEE